MGLMSFLTGGGIGAITSGVKDAASVFTVNKEAQAVRDHEATTQVQNAYASEFNTRNNRTWWDSLVDGLNRLIRPAIVVIFCSPIPVLLYAGFMNDAGMIASVSAAITALSIIPQSMWYIILGIVGFYFPLRTVDKHLARVADTKEMANKTKTIIHTLKKVHELRPGLAKVEDNDDIDDTHNNAVLRKHNIK